jgi:hypothetical protein
LLRHRDALTDQIIPLVAVARSGVSGLGVDAAYGPDELMAAWSPG